MALSEISCLRVLWYNTMLPRVRAHPVAPESSIVQSRDSRQSGDPRQSGNSSIARGLMLMSMNAIVCCGCTGGAGAEKGVRRPRRSRAAEGGISGCLVSAALPHLRHPLLHPRCGSVGSQLGHLISKKFTSAYRVSLGRVLLAC